MWKGMIRTEERLSWGLGGVQVPHQKIHHHCTDPVQGMPFADNPDLISKGLLLLSPLPSIILEFGQEWWS